MLARSSWKAVKLAEAETVTILAQEADEEVLPSPGEEAELLEAIAEADHGGTISAEELFARRNVVA